MMHHRHRRSLTRALKERHTGNGDKIMAYADGGRWYDVAFPARNHADKLTN